VILSIPRISLGRMLSLRHKHRVSEGNFFPLSSWSVLLDVLPVPIANNSAEPRTL